jgi:DNA-binding SARP family transcriptional activator
MSAGTETAYILFVDISNFSLYPHLEQIALFHKLNAVVRATAEFRRSKVPEDLVCLPGGDGMGLVFFGDPAAPARCALEIARTLRREPRLELRMGLHSGPVQRLPGINEQPDVIGPAVNTAQRVMRCAKEGEILLSDVMAGLLRQTGAWSLLYLGEREDKHGERLYLSRLDTATPHEVPSAAVGAIRMFGALEVESAGQNTTRQLGTRHARALLARLAYESGRSHSREALAEELWPEEDPVATRVRLRQALAAVRRALEPPGVVPGSVLDADREKVRLIRGAVTTDVAQFRTALASAGQAAAPAEKVRLLRQALDLRAGPLLPGPLLPCSDDPEWIRHEREQMDELHVGALTSLADALADAGEAAEAVEHASRAVREDPLREQCHRLLMELCAHMDRVPDALQQYERLKQLLWNELKTQPSLASQELERQIRSGEWVSPWRSRRPHPPPPPPPPPPDWEVIEPGGSMPLGCPSYVERETDGQFLAAVTRCDSIVLVKGPRQVGKTSLLARGLEQARTRGMRVVKTDFQSYSAQLESTDALFLAIADEMADRLGLKNGPEQVWSDRRGWNVNFERYLRNQVLEEGSAPLVWGLDEVDRLFTCPFGSEVFGLFRSWHNARSLDPTGPWSRLTLAISYATEAHLFIKDLNQSPFNVGTRLTLEDFSPEQVRELSCRYREPLLKTPQDIDQYVELVGGHPYLVRRGLYEMRVNGWTLDALLGKGDREDGPFRDHLRRLRLALDSDPEITEALRAMLQGRACPAESSFYRLRAAGVLLGETVHGAHLRCRLYQAYLTRHLL